MIQNMMEQMAAEVLEEYWNSLTMPCACQICKNDILALALNSLPPHYVSRDKGRVIENTRMLNEQSIVDILQELARAASVVKAKPSHDIL